MARNNAWSNHRLYAACAKLTEANIAPPASLLSPIPLTLSHILTVDWYYIDALVEEGGLCVFIADQPFATLAELEAAQRASDRKLLVFCEALARGRSRAQGDPRSARRRAASPRPSPPSSATLISIRSITAAKSMPCFRHLGRPRPSSTNSSRSGSGAPPR